MLPTRARAKRRFYTFTFFNVVSFSFIGVEIMTLYSLRLQASSLFLGMLSSFFFMTFFFTLIGRRMVTRMGAVRVFGTFWLIRYLLMLPVALTALPFLRDGRSLVLVVIALGVLGFNISKGVAIAAHPPILGAITGDRDRGSFLSRNQLIMHLMRIVTGISMALLLGRTSPIGTYAAFIITGIVAGVLASGQVFRLPEPAGVAKAGETDLAAAAVRAWKSPQFRRLTALTGLATFAVSMATPFLVVFFKDLYGHLDSSIVLFGVAGSIGAVGMALVSGFFVDRVGPKPLLFLFTGIALAVFVAVLFQPGTEGGVAAVVFPVVVYFLFQMGHFGMLNAADTYFFSMTRPEDRLDLGIVFGLVKGAAGFVGGFAGGAYLSLLEGWFPGNPSASFRLFFLVIVLVLSAIGLVVRRLPDAGAIPLQDALSIFFSPRDLRAIRLLNRLDRTTTHHEERRTVEALGATGSYVPVGELLAKVQSPSLFVRMEALQALRNSPTIEPEVERLLISEVKNHTFTTAHVAAEILGDRKVAAGIPVLRESLDSDDYMLVSESMVALARLGDRTSLSAIRQRLAGSRNPRVVTYAAKAVEILADPDSLDVLLRRLERKSYPFLRDEIILSIAGLLGFSDWFYPLYGRYLASSSEALSDLRDFLQQAGRPDLVDVVSAVPRSVLEFTPFATAALEELRPAVGGRPADDRIVAALSTRSVCRLERFRFLLAARLVWSVL